MYGKVSMVYAGVEVDINGINVLTTPQPLEWKEGINFEIEEDKKEQSKNIGYMVEFLQAILFKPPYVEPLQVGVRGEYPDVIFCIDNEYMLQVTVVEGKITCVLLRPENNEKLHPIRFTYSGSLMEDFFKEIKIDIERLMTFDDSSTH